MTTIQRIRVPVGFAYTVLYLWAVQPKPVWYGLAVLLAAGGLVLRIWAAGYLQKFESLTILGPYYWSQNPLYFGSFLIGLGFTVAGGQLWLIAIFLSVFLAIYLPVIEQEERELSRAYPDQYDVYRQCTFRFFPGLPKKNVRVLWPLNSGDKEFSWKRVVKNREQRGVVGFLLVAIVVFVKMQLS